MKSYQTLALTASAAWLGLLVTAGLSDTGAISTAATALVMTALLAVFALATKTGLDRYGKARKREGKRV